MCNSSYGLARLKACIRVCVFLPLFVSPKKKVGLAIEGGGMRGCVSAGMIGAVSTLGLMDTFDAVYGSSAGSLVGAYAIAGQVLQQYFI